MDYLAFKELSFEQQLDVLVKSNMLSKKGSFEVSGARERFPGLNAYEIQEKLVLCYPEINIFRDFEDDEKFKELHQQEIKDYCYQPSEDKKSNLVCLFMKFFKGGRRPEEALPLIDSLLMQTPY